MSFAIFNNWCQYLIFFYIISKNNIIKGASHFFKLNMSINLFIKIIYDFDSCCLFYGTKKFWNNNEAYIAMHWINVSKDIYFYKREKILKKFYFYKLNFYFANFYCICTSHYNTFLYLFPDIFYSLRYINFGHWKK